VRRLSATKDMSLFQQPASSKYQGEISDGTNGCTQ
jgi:hypothetical protein